MGSRVSCTVIDAEFCTAFLNRKIYSSTKMESSKLPISVSVECSEFQFEFTPMKLLRSSRYSCPIDVWSIGCIMAEMVTKKPLFQGDSEIDQLYRIFRVLKTPTEEMWPGVSKMPDYKPTFPSWNNYHLQNQVKQLDSIGFDLLQKTLIYDPAMRITAIDALDHPWFADLDKSILPTNVPV